MPSFHATDAAVLAFYRELPFNQQATPQAQAAAIRKRNSVLVYPVLPPLLTAGCTVLEVGCGTGWFSNSLSYHYPVQVTGIDFNPVAIGFARAAATELAVASQFAEADLFAYQPRAVDVVVSIGVLHHTHDCLAAVKRVAGWVRPGGYLFVGLYHRDGRVPFLAHFQTLKDRGASEAELFARYRALHGTIRDETQVYSWFRDQVLHPHETQHTVAELLPVFADAGLSLAATSINQFQPIADMNADVLAKEPGLQTLAESRLAAGQYDPGFFVVLAHKTG